MVSLLRRWGFRAAFAMLGLCFLPTAAVADCKGLSVTAQSQDNGTSGRPSKMGHVVTKDGKLAPRGAITVHIAPWDLLAACFDGKVEPTLFLDHLPMTALPTTGRFVWEDESANKDQQKKFVALSFRLDKPSKAEDAWNELLYRDWQSDVQRPVSVGIGTGGEELLTLPGHILLTVGKGNPSWAKAALGVSILAVLLVGLGSRALEDSREGEFTSFSLSRLVLSCWVATTTSVVIVVWRHSQALPSFSDGGLAFMLAATGFGVGFSTWLDARRQIENKKQTNVVQDLLYDEDGLALHRVQSLIFNSIILWVVWADLIAYGTVAQVSSSWANLLGASTLTYLFGRGAEDPAPADLASRPAPVLQGPLKQVSGAVLDKLKALGVSG
jgi:hypothetical protein